MTCKHPDGCDRPVKARGWCRAHNDRIKKTGSPGPASIQERLDPKRPCSVDDCQNEAGRGGLGMCNKHYLRYRSNGDPLVVRKSGGGSPLERNPNWSGDQASSSAVHLRLKSNRGPASQHQCVDCGGQARHWSYSGRVSESTRYGQPGSTRHDSSLTYSVDMNDYDPRCVRCHSAHDRGLALTTEQRPD